MSNKGEKMASKVGVAVVGVGFVGGQAHAPSFKKIESSNLVALCDTLEDARAIVTPDIKDIGGLTGQIMTKNVTVVKTALRTVLSQVLKKLSTI
jgi:hypothetical protein